MIKKLPNFIINKLKAWEIVERPASVLKELIENSIDAQSNEIVIKLENWWTNLIQVIDNWTWIEIDDVELVLERYATSKIQNEKDLQNISTYWFRWEALASISEVSKITIQTKTSTNPIWIQIFKQNQQIEIKKISTSFDHWTNILVQDLFFNTPARLKFMKTPSTEYKYCQETFYNFVLVNPQIKRSFFHNWKLIFKNNWNENIKNLIAQIYKKDWLDNIYDINYENKNLKITWILWDSMISFPNYSWIKIFVNKRPIENKTIKKAILEAFKNQIPHWFYPLVYIYIEINPNLIDVNVHPRKKEVKFIDNQMIYWNVFNSIKNTLSKIKIINTDKLTQNLHKTENKPYWFKSTTKYYSNNHKINNQKTSDPTFLSENKLLNENLTLTTQTNFEEINKELIENKENINTFSQDNNQQINYNNFKIIWQYANLYIIAEYQNDLFYIDQHALAERINFEKIKSKWLWNKKNLLTPITIKIPQNIQIEEKIKQLYKLHFECELLSENLITIYTIPEIFEEYPIDFEKVFEKILFLDQINFDVLLDKIFATKACRISIKAWDKLTIPEMQNLIKEAFEYIPWNFVCPHWRPFFIRIKKSEIDKLFDR